MRKRFTLLFVVAIVFFLSSLGNAQSFFNLVFEMSGDEQSPPVETGGYGFGWAKLDLQERKVTYAVAYDSLSGPPSAAHFHLGDDGENGPPIHTITFDANGVATGEWTNIPDTTLAHFLKGRVYCNIHTTANSGGEIRGQLEYVGPLTFTFLAEGANANPPSGENGKTVGFGILSGGTIVVYGIAKGLTGPPTMAHIHYGAVGQSGSPAITLAASGSLISGGGMMPNDSSYRKLLNGELYFNIHTAAHTGGELRGQLMGTRFYPFWATMDGFNAVPPNISSTGEGFFLLRYDAVENAIEYITRGGPLI